jgi:flavin reductase (DIM6/NTAB) family NADH-FMN oxidoreductase RutF
VLPQWPAGTVTILATAGDRPRAIPVSAATRVDERRVLIALAAGRQSLARLRTDGRVALAIIAEDLAVTVHGTARVVEEELLPGVVAVEVTAEEVQDHDRPEFAIEGGVRWRWTDKAAARRDTEVWRELERLALR